MRRLCFLLSVLTLAFSHLFGGSPAPQTASPDAPAKPKNILFVTSYNSGLDWTKDVIEGFNDHFRRADFPSRIDVVELRVLKNIREGAGEEDFQRAVERIKNKRPDVLVVVDLPAILFLQQYYAELPPDLPILICGYPDFLTFPRADYPNVAQMQQRLDLGANIELGLTLFPDTQEIALVTDAGPEGVALEAHARALLKNFSRAKVRYLNGKNLTTDEMLEQVAAMPKNSMVFHGYWKSEKQEVFLSFQNILSHLIQTTPGPVVALIENADPQMLGGIMSMGIPHGKRAGELAEQMIRGTPPADIPSEKDPGVTQLNWSALQRFDIPLSKLPKGAIIEGMPPSIWENHRDLLLLILTSFLILLFWLFFSLRGRSRLRQTKVIYDHLPLRIAAFDKDGKAVFSHAFGGTHKAVSHINDFRHDAQILFKNGIAEAFKTGNPQSFEYDLEGKRRKAILSLLPSKNFGRGVVLAVSMDVTDLHASRRELQSLTEHLRITIDSIGDGVIATDAEQTITIFNEVAAGMTGYTAQEAVGKKLDEVFNIISYLTEKPVPSPLRKAIEEDRIVELANHTDLIAKDGRRLHIADSAAPIRDPDGTIRGAILVFRDVTQEYERRDQMAQANLLLSSATDIAGMVCFKAGADLVVKPEQIPSNYWASRDGRLVPISEWVMPEDRDEFKRQWHALHKGEISQMDLVYGSEFGGQKNYFNIRVVAQKTKEGASKEFYGVIQDVTKTRTAELSCRDTGMLLKGILDSLPSCVFVKDYSDGGRYILSNRYHQKFVGDYGSCVGKTDAEFFPEPLCTNFRNEDLQVIADGGLSRTHDFFPQSDGSVLTAHTYKTRIDFGTNRKLLLGISVDVTELDAAREHLNRHIEQERIINSCLEAIALEHDHGAVLNRIVQVIGEHSKADRCYIFAYDDEASTFSNLSEWCGEGVNPEIDSLQDIPTSVNPAWNEALRKREIILSSDIEKDRPAPIAERASYETLSRQGIRSLIVTGIWERDRLWGFIGLDFVKTQHTFTEEDKHVMQSASRMVEIAMERKRGTEILESSELEKRMILDSIQIPVLLFDNKGKLITVNPAARDIVGGKPLAQVIGEPCYINYCGCTSMPEQCPVQACIRDHKARSFEFALGDREYHTSTRPIFDKDGKLIYVLESSIDMTEFNEGKRKLEKAMYAAEEASRAKSYFLASMSHELRTPLNAVIGYSEIMQDPAIPQADRVENLKNIHFAANALLALINDVLDLSKLEAGQMGIVKSPTNLGEIVREITRVLELRAKNKGLEMRVIVPENLPWLLLDSMRVRQILMNLIGNAVKFTDTGSVCVSVSYTPAKDGKGILRIAVADTGMGIAQEYKTKIFNPFEQQPKNWVRGQRVYEGTGLGLSISQRFVAKMGGRIDLESELNKGSIFTIVLENVEACADPSLQKQLTSDAPKKQLAKLETGRVLIVDDVLLNLKVLGAMLAREGVAYSACLSGGEALEALQKENFSLVLTDLWMTGISGQELAAMMKKDPKTAHIPVVAVTADSQAGNEDRLFDDLLLKPISVEKVRSILERFGAGRPD